MEGHRHGRDASGARGELALSLVSGEAAYVHACDLDPRGDAIRRPRKGESDRQQGQQQDGERAESNLGDEPDQRGNIPPSRGRPTPTYRLDADVRTHPKAASLATSRVGQTEGMAQFEHPADVLVEEAAASKRDERPDRASGVAAVGEEDEIGSCAKRFARRWNRLGAPEDRDRVRDRNPAEAEAA